MRTMVNSASGNREWKAELSELRVRFPSPLTSSAGWPVVRL
jgi:hypothetical protein